LDLFIHYFINRNGRLLLNVSFLLREIMVFDPRDTEKYWITSSFGSREQIAHEEFLSLEIRSEKETTTVRALFERLGLVRLLQNGIYFEKCGDVTNSFTGFKFEPRTLQDAYVRAEIEVDDDGDVVSASIGSGLCGMALPMDLSAAKNILTVHFHPDEDTLLSPVDFETMVKTQTPGLIISGSTGRGQLYIWKDLSRARQLLDSHHWNILGRKEVSRKFWLTVVGQFVELADVEMFSGNNATSASAISSSSPVSRQDIERIARRVAGSVVDVSIVKSILAAASFAAMIFVPTHIMKEPQINLPAIKQKARNIFDLVSDLVRQHAVEYSQVLNKKLLVAIAKVENQSHIKKTSGMGARGTMQLMPGTVADIKKEIKERKAAGDMNETQTRLLWHLGLLGKKIHRTEDVLRHHDLNVRFTI